MNFNKKKLGFGLMRLPMIGERVDIEQTKQMVDLFMGKGFTYFDTAYGYLNEQSEGAIREALVERYPRDYFQLATKLPAFAASNAAQAQEMFWTSLQRTGVDYFDFYLLHNLGGDRAQIFEDYGIWDFVAEQKKQGRIRYSGFSAHASAAYLEQLLVDHPEVDFVQLQINYADWENSIVQSRACYEVARQYEKPVIVMEPVKGGSLANLPPQAAAILQQVNPGLSQASWAIRYAASLEGVLTVLSGMSTLDQMKDNVSYMEAFEPMREEEYAAIAQVQQILDQIPQVPCTDCRYCEKGCPQHVSIPGIFKNYNDYLRHHDLELIRGDYEWQVGNGARACACIGCGACERVCPQSIAIIQELKKAAEIFDLPR